VISVRAEIAAKVYRLCVRIFTFALAFLAVGWGVTAFPIFWRQSSIEQVARRIINGEPFTREALDSQMVAAKAAENETYCRPAGIRSAAIIQIRMAEQALGSGDQSAIDSAFLDLEGAVRGSLACNPADPFLWLSLFWATNTRNAPSPTHFEYLRLSYELGPNEAWIAVTRNRIALALYATLPVDLRKRAVLEFVSLIKTGLPQLAADIFIGPGWPVRDILLAEVANLDEASRTAFQRSLHDRDRDDVKVPGLQGPANPPWQH
jgi:hypothetical protein